MPWELQYCGVWVKRVSYAPPFWTALPCGFCRPTMDWWCQTIYCLWDRTTSSVSIQYPDVTMQNWNVQPHIVQLKTQYPWLVSSEMKNLLELSLTFLTYQTQNSISTNSNGNCLNHKSISREREKWSHHMCFSLFVCPPSIFWVDFKI